MPFPIDVSHPFRYPSELKRLVQAVRDAGDYDETRWIEWKRTLDLTATTSIRHIVRQILGFANRDPQVAAGWASGFAYLVIGANPGSLEGVTQVDPEQLVSKIRPYVGSHVTWTPEYIDVDGAKVLVIIVEPPRPGDEIHALRRALDPYKPGTVFTRRPGQTDQADADELAMLQRRLLARTPQVELSVEPVPPAIEVWPDFQSLIDSWADQERTRRLVARYQPEPTAEEEQPVIMESFFAAAGSADRRTIDQYESQIDSYIADAKKALLERGVWRLARHRPSALVLQVINRSARNYAQVGVTLTIKPGMVRAYDKGLLDLVDEREPRLPKPPAPLGAPMADRLAGWGGLRSSRMPRSVGLRGIGLPTWRRGWQASNTADGAKLNLSLVTFGLRGLPSWLPSHLLSSLDQAPM